ncbi:hypothetical protein V1515DRAFT_611087 [Lipomyces mesembrius]
MGTRLLDDQDRGDSIGRRARYNENVPPELKLPLSSSRRFQNDADGILLAWKAVVYASTEDEFWKAWANLREEFPLQERTYCYPYVKLHRNYGIRVTSCCKEDSIF